MKVEAPNNLAWTVGRPLLPDWLRPARPRDIPSAGRAGGLGRGGALGPALAVGAVFSLVLLPLLALMPVLRRRGLAASTLEAVARPWGRRGQPVVLRHSLRGRPEDVERAEGGLVEKLRRGDGAPEPTGAERIR